jgi:hypothetical protein
MKLAVLAALCVLALGKLPSSSWEREYLPERSLDEDVFGPRKQFDFEYNGQVATGIPSSSKQHSAMRIQAAVSVIFKEDDICILKIDRVRFGKMNRRIPDPKPMIPFMAFEEVPMESDKVDKLKLPIQFTYRMGLIRDLVFDGREKTWSANIKRGIVQMLQVNLKKHEATDLSEEAIVQNRISDTDTPNKDFFTVMEKNIEGQCETMYTVTSQPCKRCNRDTPVLNVTRTVNFEKCQKRPQIKYNFRFQDPCPTCEPRYNEDQKFLRTSTLTKFNIRGTRDEFLIEFVNTESQYHIVPFTSKGNIVTTYVNQVLILRKSGPITKRIDNLRSPISSDTDMIYSLDWDIMKEKFFMDGEDEFLEKTPYSELRNKVEFVSKILRGLISDMRGAIQTEAPIKYARLVKIFRMLKRSELEEIHETFYKSPARFTPEEHEKVKSILMDVVADAGTKPCIMHLIGVIKRREVNPLRAALSIKSLINCRVISKEMIEELMNLAESPVCERNWFLRQSVYLTIGSMVNGLCAKNEDLLASEFKIRSPMEAEKFCPRVFKERLVEKMINKFKNAPTFNLKVLYLKSLGNMGLEPSVFELEKIIKDIDSKYPTLMRTEAVLAMRQVRHLMPKKVRKICMPVFMNRMAPEELRIACAHMIFQTIPPRPLLDQMSRTIFNERNMQVSSFVYSYMVTISKTTNPCMQKFKHDLLLSLRFAKQVKCAYNPLCSKHLHMPMHSSNYRMGLNLNFNSIMSKNTLIPKMLNLDLSTNFMGFWSKHLVMLGVTIENLDSLLYKYLGPKGYWNEKNLEDILVREPRSTRTNSPNLELKSLWRKLKITGRSLPSSPKGYFFLKYKDQEFGMLPFDLRSMAESLSDFIKDGRVDLRDIESFMESGYNFHFYKAIMLHEMNYKIPTSIGMPLVFTLKVPSIQQLTGQVKANIRNGWKKISVDLKDVEPSSVTTMITSVEVWSPIVNTGLKVLATAKLHVPIDGKMTLDMGKSVPQLKGVWTPPKNNVDWLVLETRPITTTMVWPKYLTEWKEAEEKTVMGEEWNKRYNFDTDFPLVKKMEKTIEKVFGLETRVVGFWHHSPAMRLSNTPVCPLSGPNKLIIRTRPTPDMPKEVVLEMKLSLLSPLRSALRPKFENFNDFLRKEDDEEEIHSEWRELEGEMDMESLLKTRLYTKGRKEVSLETETKIKCGHRLRYCKVESTLEQSRIPDLIPEPYKICLDGEILYPKTPYNFRDLVGRKVVSTWKTTWGRDCDSSNHVTLKLKVDRSKEQMKRLETMPEFRLFRDEERCRTDPELCSPVSVYPTLKKASRLLNAKAEIEYRNVPPMMKRLTKMVFRAFKTYYYSNSRVDDVDMENPRNKINIHVTLDPDTNQYVNVTVKAPLQNVIFKEIPLPIPLKPANMKRRFHNIKKWDDVQDSILSANHPVCHVSSHKIETFDKVTYRVPLTTCWSVLAKDCRTENFAVLMKRMSPDSAQKKMKIVTRTHKIELLPETREYDSIKVKVNGEEMEIPKTILSHNHHVLKLEKIGPYVKVSLPESGIRVYFDGYATNIKMTPMLRNLQCGLCGHFDDEPLDEFRNPEFGLETDVRSFFRKFTIKDEDCEIPSRLTDICEDSECRYRSPLDLDMREEEDRRESRESSSEESSESRRSDRMRNSMRPIRKTKVIEQNSKICFSKRPVPVCPLRSYPSSVKSEERRVVYCCLSRDDPDAEVLLHKVRREMRVPNEIDDLPTSFTQTEFVPDLCTRL